MAVINNDKEMTEWNISTDIYDIVKSVEGVKRRYIEDEDETTLALGIYGFLGDTEAKKIQTATIMTGELGNEMFSTRSKLTKNVLSHAIYNNITDINAVPSRMTINIGIKVDDLNTYMRSNRFVFDAECPIFIGNYEFHFDYDIVLNRSALNPNMYSAHYDMTVPNRISNILNPYLKQPFVIRLGNFDYVILQALVRQVTIEKTLDKIISNSIIENKTYTFDFDNQIADFDVIVTDNGKETRLTPLLYGSSSEDIEKYCWYLFISDNTIRIAFDRKSFIPGLNSDIQIKAYTTLGSKGVFSYKKYDVSSEGLFVDIESSKYEYSKITCYMVAITDSVNGTDRKTKEELQKLIPKAALARGAITTEKDVDNYFNLIDNEVNRLVMQKKVDNQLSRIWYGYFVLKDEMNNIIPTNTIMLELDTSMEDVMYKAEDGRFILPAGTIVHYDMENRIGKIVDEADTPDIYSKEYFDNKNYYYMTVYNIILNPDPLYAAFHLAISDKNSFFSFEWVNEASNLQFVANRCNFQRNLLTDQSTYKFTFGIAQAISGDFGMYYEENIEEITPEGESISKTIVTNNMKCVMVLYRSGEAYRWVEAELTNFNFSNYVSSWEVRLETDNGMDNENRIKIRNLKVVGKENETNYGYFDPNTKAVLYILAKFEEGKYGRYNLDEIAPNCFNEYSVTNVYEVEDGFVFYENFTNILDTRVYAVDEMDDHFRISGVPVVGLHYMTDEYQASYLVDAIAERRAYIDYCLVLLENSMRVDFKFFNTYGPSVTYSIGDKQNTMIGHVDLCLKFRVSMKDISDVYTKDDIIAEIKDYIEDLYETGDLHIPNLITELSNKFSNRCNFIEFMNFNDFWLGVQHIVKLPVDNPHIVPEFLNIRNRYNEEEDKLEPCIDVEVLY